MMRYTAIRPRPSLIKNIMHQRYFPSARRNTILLVAFVTTALFSPVQARDLAPTQAEDVGMSTARLQRVDAVLNQYVIDGKLPGGVVLVARRGKVAYRKAFGLRDIEANAPMAPDNIFRIASQTKALVSVGIMMLQEQGKLRIEEPLGKYLPEFQETTVAVANDRGSYDVVPADRPITLRNLLTHTSGIDYGAGVAADKWAAAKIGGWYFADRDEPIAATVSRMASLPFHAQPGKKWVYGYSTDILGVVIERVSGKSLDEYLRTEIINPLGMTNTHFYLPESKQDRLATVYSLSNGLKRAPDPGGMVGQGTYVHGPRKSFSGGAGLLSTADDYARFLQMMLNGGELDGVRLLSPNTVALMTTNHIGSLSPDYSGDGAGFGLGFSVVKDFGARGWPGSNGEYGWGGAYHTTYWVDPKEKLVVVYLTQVRPSEGLDDQHKLRALVYAAIVK